MRPFSFYPKIGVNFMQTLLTRANIVMAQARLTTSSSAPSIPPHSLSQPDHSPTSYAGVAVNIALVAHIESAFLFPPFRF